MGLVVVVRQEALPYTFGGSGNNILVVYMELRAQQRLRRKVVIGDLGMSRYAKSIGL